jgi:hypothetical protein
MKINKKAFFLFLLLLFIVNVGVVVGRSSRSKPLSVSPQPSPQTEETNQPIEPDSSNPLIQLDSPSKDQPITSPLKVTGKARGNWYFEGSFPVILTDENGKVVTQGVAQAQGEWMTEELVPFETLLTFTQPIQGTKGKLTLKKDNPSGLPENDKSFEVPVYFK